MSVVLVFDDNDDERKEVVEGLQKELGDTAEVVPFIPGLSLPDDTSFDRYITSWLSNELRGKDIGLVVCDKELGRYDHMKGLSATPVAAVALQEGLPFCQYSRQAKEGSREFERFQRLRQWSAAEITLEGIEPIEWVRQAASLLHGFELVRSEYVRLGSRPGTPASALAAVLGKPETESRIALYGSGEQGFLKEILAAYDPEHPNMEAMLKRMPRILGNWLFLSILRFPGILLNSIATASYLNIDPTTFQRENIRQEFAHALYTGPFHELGPWWWRAAIDAHLGDAGFGDGREFLDKAGVSVAPCVDPQSHELAGYYCMLTRSPVSANNSCGGITWFPAGADLARIRKDKFEQITALVGMY
jgi:hypothetical protein